MWVIACSPAPKSHLSLLYFNVGLHAERGAVIDADVLEESLAEEPSSEVLIFHIVFLGKRGKWNRWPQTILQRFRMAKLSS